MCFAFIVLLLFFLIAFPMINGLLPFDKVTSIISFFRIAFGGCGCFKFDLKNAIIHKFGDLKFTIDSIA